MDSYLLIEQAKELTANLSLVAPPEIVEYETWHRCDHGCAKFRGYYAPEFTLERAAEELVIAIPSTDIDVWFKLLLADNASVILEFSLDWLRSA